MRFWGISITAVFLTASIAFAQVEVETEFGFHGDYHPDLPTPIQILVKNDGPPFQGQLIISQEVRSPWQGTFAERLLFSFELPRGAERLLQLNFTAHGYIYPLSIEIVADGKVIYEEEIELKRRFREERLVLALSDAPFPGELPTGERPLQVKPGSLPQEWPGLLGVRRIYLGRFNPSSMPRERWLALLRWLERGGELVVLGGANWYLQGSPRLRELLPFMPREIAELEGQPIVLGEPRGEVLYREDSLPILIATRQGRGRVIFSTIDPLSRSTGEEFWERLSDPVDGLDLDEERLGLAAGLLDSLRLSFPSKLALIGIYSLYLGGLALLGWLALRRQRLIALIPLWIAGISILTVRAIDRPEFAKPLVGLELEIAHDMGRTTLRTTWLSLFARADGELRLPLELEDGLLLQAIPAERGDHLYDMDYLREWGKMVISFRMGRWQRRSFYLERFSGDLASFKVEGEQVMVENLSSHPLRDCLLWERNSGRLYKIGDIGPHEAAERTVGPEAPFPEEPTRAKLFALVRGEALGERALFCTVEQEGFPSLPREVRATFGLALIEEDR